LELRIFTAIAIGIHFIIMEILEEKRLCVKRK
jgi:hypothetical protein